MVLGIIKGIAQAKRLPDEIKLAGRGNALRADCAVCGFRELYHAPDPRIVRHVVDGDGVFVELDYSDSMVDVNILSFAI